MMVPSSSRDIHYSGSSNDRSHTYRDRPGPLSELPGPIPGQSHVVVCRSLLCATRNSELNYLQLRNQGHHLQEAYTGVREASSLGNQPLGLLSSQALLQRRPQLSQDPTSFPFQGK